MSAQHSSSTPPTGAGGSGSDGPAGNHDHPIDGAASVEPGLPLAAADLAHLLAHGQWTDGTVNPGPVPADANAYDGHVALALDTGILPEIDSTHDLLASSHHLFDVPALDVSASPDDTSSS
jgi:hypothetical protein